MGELRGSKSQFVYNDLTKWLESDLGDSSGWDSQKRILSVLLERKDGLGRLAILCHFMKSITDKTDRSRIFKQLFLPASFTASTDKDYFVRLKTLMEEYKAASSSDIFWKNYVSRRSHSWLKVKEKVLINISKMPLIVIPPASVIIEMRFLLKRLLHIKINPDDSMEERLGNLLLGHKGLYALELAYVQRMKDNFNRFEDAEFSAIDMGLFNLLLIIEILLSDNYDAKLIENLEENNKIISSSWWLWYFYDIMRKSFKKEFLEAFNLEKRDPGVDFKMLETGDISLPESVPPLTLDEAFSRIRTHFERIYRYHEQIRSFVYPYFINNKRDTEFSMEFSSLFLHHMSIPDYKYASGKSFNTEARDNFLSRNSNKKSFDELKKEFNRIWIRSEKLFKAGKLKHNNAEESIMSSYGVFSLLLMFMESLPDGSSIIPYDLSTKLAEYELNRFKGKGINMTKISPLVSISRSAYRSIALIANESKEKRVNGSLDFFNKQFIEKALHLDNINTIKIKKRITESGNLTEKIIEEWTPLDWTLYNLVSPFIKTNNDVYNFAKVVKKIPYEDETWEKLLEKWIKKPASEELKKRISTGKVRKEDDKAISEAMLKKHGESLDFLEFLMGLTIEGNGMDLLEAMQNAPELMFNLAQDPEAISHFVSLANDPALLELIKNQGSNYKSFRSRLISRAI